MLVLKRGRLFKILDKINCNAYRVDLLGEYDINTTFNVCNISLFDISDNLKSNPFEDQMYDIIKTTSKDLLQGPIERHTRSRANKPNSRLYLNFLGQS